MITPSSIVIFIAPFEERARMKAPPTSESMFLVIFPSIAEIETPFGSSLPSNKVKETTAGETSLGISSGFPVGWIRCQGVYRHKCWARSGAGRARYSASLDIKSPLLYRLYRNRNRFQPMLPSISSAISLFNSTAYSIGSSLTKGSKNPLTMRANASSSEWPRLIR